MDSLQDIIKEAAMSHEKNVLATIIHIDGSAYRKTGAMMLFGEKGLQMGMLSGGCLEEDLAQRAMVLMHETDIRAQKVSYDMTAEDDLGWGRGAGCNGVVHILIEKVDTSLQTQLQRIQTFFDNGVTVSLTKEIIPIESTSHRTHLESNLKNVITHTKIIPSKSALGKMPFFKNKSLGKTDVQERDYQTLFTQLIRPKPRLIVFGAGVDVRPLAMFAHQTGFSVTIWDWRQSFLKQSLFPNTLLIHETSMKDFILKMGITDGDYVVIMTHDFQKDKEIMHHMLQIEGLQYLGILGPRRRTKRLIQNKFNVKGSKSFRTIPRHVHSPVGLPIGADGPDEIAISILADLISAKRGKLDEKRTSIEQM